MDKLKFIALFSFIFTSQLSGQNSFRNIKVTTETENSIRAYLDSSSLDVIEGIYKSTSGTFYEIAIKKYDDLRYLAIILDADNKNRWKEGTVKAYIEKSATDGIFSIRYLMGNKKPTETTGVLKYGTLLSMWIPSGPYGIMEEAVFLKMYPAKATETKKSFSSITVTGSCFFITSQGLLATNAHVVEGAKKIEIKVSNELGGITYHAKLILIDAKNDVAILQIDDSSFKDLRPLPYGITESADIGEKSFTIGYPLNDIMGKNYKVTDGIISSKTGIADDIRYYQITVPIQPGNSGGPLFNNEGNIIGITSAKLSGKTLAMQIENVSYAIKAAYLSNLINMIPNIEIPRATNQLKGKELKEQIKILKDYVCLIQVTE